MTDKLLDEFASNYIEKIFYFCLKKTGNSTEAEDLTQDIALNVISALNKGTLPDSFSAWVWKIARNRYASWANEKHIRSESLTGYDIGDCEIADTDNGILDEMSRDQALISLRRELAFIKRDYRDIVVAYYIEERSVRFIAESLSLSETAVKQRLFRARKLLKEGMNMAREFGKRSYTPEDVSFVSSGAQPSGLPWSVIQRRIPKNILLQASNNPSTLEELAIELGIALPYMEEEVEILREATLLEKQGDRYVTSFFIFDRECQLDCYNTIRPGSRERGEALEAFLNDRISDIRALGIAGDHIDDNKLKWVLALRLLDYCVDNCCDGRIKRRSNGEAWGITGYESCSLPEETFVGLNGNGNERSMFWAYKIGDYGLWDQCGEMCYMGVLLMGECIRSQRALSDLSSDEKELWDTEINGKYAHSDANGRIILDIPIFRGGDMSKLYEIFRAHPSYEVIQKNIKDIHDKLYEILIRYSHSVLRDTLEYNISSLMYRLRMILLHDLVDSGALTLPQTPETSSLGMYMIIQ